MGAQTPEQRIVALIKAAAAEADVQTAVESTPPRVVVYGAGSVVAAGDVHIHHHYCGNAKKREDLTQMQHLDC